MGPPIQEVTVAGIVVERGTLSSIGGATVSLSGKPAFFTGLDGRFRFTEVVPGSATLTISALGYHPLNLELYIRGDTTLTVEMDPDPIRMDSLLVMPGKISIRGTIRDGVSGLRVPRANLYIGSGQETTANHRGFFLSRIVLFQHSLGVRGRPVPKFGPPIMRHFGSNSLGFFLTVPTGRPILRRVL